MVEKRNKTEVEVVYGTYVTIIAHGISASRSSISSIRFISAIAGIIRNYRVIFTLVAGPLLVARILSNSQTYPIIAL